MPYFTIQKTFLVDSFELPKKERENLDNFLKLLEDSGVGEIIENIIDRDPSKGGRPRVNPYRLFAAIIYVFSRSDGSLRKVEEYMRFDLRVLYLMNQEICSYVTIAEFLNNVVVKEHKKIYTNIVKTFVNMVGLNIDDCFLDGTKLEANANKYKFVWKPTTFHKKLNENIISLLNKYFTIDSKHWFTSIEVGNYVNKFQAKIIKEQGCINPTGKGKKCTKLDKDLTLLNKYLLKLIEYEEKEEICGELRNSYYKTDRDATAMCLKEDYYSGLGSNMHAGYNLQIIVSKGLILDYIISQERNDFYAFIPTLEEFYSNYGYFPKNLCADSGYGSYKNYKFLTENNIGNFVKYNFWTKDVKGEHFELIEIDNATGDAFCLNHKVLEKIPYTREGRHAKKQGNELYVVKNCKYCRYKKICRAPVKDKKGNERYFELNKEMISYRREARENLLSVKGIEMRVNRSSQVEGAFGIIKQDMGVDRYRRRGLERVSLETMLICLGYLTRKVFSYFNGTARFDYWIAPDSLVPEVIPTAKDIKIKVTKKNKIGKNKKLTSSYKHKRFIR